jgi:hypothetical protein
MQGEIAMTLYEISAEMEAINRQIEEYASEHFGEIPENLDAMLDNLQMAKEDKIKNICLFIKNLTSEAKAIKAEEAVLAERRRRNENKADRLESYLSVFAVGEKHSDGQYALSWRKSTSVVVNNFAELPQAFWRIPEPPAPQPDKAAIKEAIGKGVIVPGASLKENLNPQIK